MTSQVQFINRLLDSKNYGLITLNNLNENYFFSTSAEFTFIKNHYNTYQTVPDKLTFVDTFPDFPIVEVTEPDNYIVTELIHDYQIAYGAETFNKAKSALEAGDNEKFMKILLGAVENIPQGNAIQCVDLIHDRGRYDNFVDRTNNRDSFYLSTGFEELDKIIGGIDRKNENMVIAARTGVGKSWTLLKMACAASKAGLNVGIYSGEMSVDKVGYRIDTLLGHMPNIAISRGELLAMKEYKNYMDSLPNLGYGSINVLTPAMIAGPATVSALQAFVERYKLDILFIDQYSLLEDDSKARVMHEKVANISKAIKNLQVLKEIPIIAVSQMNRTKNEDGSQDTTQIGLSDRIGQDATCIIMLDKKDDIFTLNIVKARDGGDGRKLEYKVDLNRGEFTYMPSEQDGITSQEDLESLRDRYESSNYPPDEETPF